MSRATKPRAADVARWVALANVPEPSQFMRAGRREWKADRDRALGQLSSWGLDANGQPVKAVQS